MGKIFTELKPMGLSGLDEDDKTLFDNGRTSHLNMVSESEKKEQEKQAGKEFEKDSLFDKKYECPICDYKFTQRTVRTGRTRLLSTDTDLRHKFRYFDPIKYDIIACPKCGYAALGQKSFIGISSTSAVKAQRSQIAYTASKAAMDAAMRVMAKELASKSIRVNTIRPGAVHTEMHAEFMALNISDQPKEVLMADQYLGIAEPQDIAVAAAYLLSNASRFVTGTSLLVDGGFLS